MGNYSTAVLADNPLHYWRLADPAGGLANDLGSARPFPLWAQGGPVFGMTGYGGPNLDGGSAICNTIVYLNSIANIPFTPPVSVDWILWIPGPRADNVQSFPWGWGDNTVGPYHNEPGTGVYDFNFNAQASVNAVAPTAQRWHHFAWTYASGATTFLYYIDGTPQTAPSAFAAVGNSNYQLQLGKRVGPGAQWVGAMSEFAIYPTVLSGARINAHVAAMDTTTAPPVAGNAGGLTGAATAPINTDLLQQILQSVRQVY